MELKLEHIAPYLPYNPKVLNGYGDISDLKTELIRYPKLFLNKSKIENTALILNPLSELNQEGEIHTPEYIQSCTYQYVEYLLENHYDIYGLIDNGLAIDINTI